MVDYLRNNLRTILIALLLFFGSSLLKLVIVPIFLPDTFPIGFPLRFFLTWGPCPQGLNCSEFNGLNLILDLLIWYAVSSMLESRRRNRE